MRTGFSVHPSAGQAGSIKPAPEIPAWYSAVPVPGRFEKTGEFREPMPHEWYMDFGGEPMHKWDISLVPEWRGLGQKRFILRYKPGYASLPVPDDYEKTGEFRELRSWVVKEIDLRKKKSCDAFLALGGERIPVSIHEAEEREAGFYWCRKGVEWE